MALNCSRTDAHQAQVSRELQMGQVEGAEEQRPIQGDKATRLLEGLVLDLKLKLDEESSLLIRLLMTWRPTFTVVETTMYYII